LVILAGAAVAAEWLAQHVTQDPELQQEWIRQDNLAYGGLKAIGIVLVQPFVGGASLDTSGMICAVAFAIPLLAALVLVNTRKRSGAVGQAHARSWWQGPPPRPPPSWEWLPGSGTSTGSPAWGF
jgi:hypothetical protein